MYALHKAELQWGRNRVAPETLVLDRKLEVDPFLQECQFEALSPWNPDRAKIMSATRQERKANYIFEKWLVGGTVGR